MAFVDFGSVNSTYWPAVRLTAERPDASDGSVYASRPVMTVPLVAAFSASCSLNATLAPRPATSAGSRAARVTGLGVESASAPPPATMLNATPASTVVDATPTVAHRDRICLMFGDIG